MLRAETFQTTLVYIFLDGFMVNNTLIIEFKNQKCKKLKNTSITILRRVSTYFGYHRSTVIVLKYVILHLNYNKMRKIIPKYNTLTDFNYHG